MKPEIEVIVVKKIKGKNKYSIIIGAEIIGGEVVDALSGHELGKNTRSFFGSHGGGESIPESKSPKLKTTKKTTKKTSMRGKK